ncbi:lyase family protein [Rothia nasimurium]|uniref:lyase family protein n=1 Tax=Rothia nasimurium TaxID=85336 RepID=UPI003BA2ABDA
MGSPVEAEIQALAVEAEAGGNPVIGLVRLLRQRVAQALGEKAASFVHTGLTSQDVVDTALALCLKFAMESIDSQLQAAGSSLADMVVSHRCTPMMGRTLGQAALPITFGLRAAGWLNGLTQAHALLRREIPEIRASFSGAAGDLATASTLLAGGASLPEEEKQGQILTVQEVLEEELGLRVDFYHPWHTQRVSWVASTRTLADVCLALGKIANDVIEASRTEAGELAEPRAEGRGSSSAMAHKRNPSLSILIRRSALSASTAVGALYQAAALAHEERPAGAWHAEWEPVRSLITHAVIASQLARELLEGLEVFPDRMAQNLRESLPEEQLQRDLSGSLGQEMITHSLEAWAASRLGYPR